MLRKEINPKISRRLGFVLTFELALGLLLSLSTLALFAKIVEDVVEDESRQFDDAVLLWIHTNSPGWFHEPMLFITALGYYWFVLPLLVVAAYAFYRKNASASAALLVISTVGGAVLSDALKSIFRRARPELFDSGYTASFYSFPSGHATIAVSFYGTLTLLVAWRLRGLRRWTTVAAGVALILLIGFSRLYLGVHYPTDVLAGFLVALLWIGFVGLCYFLWRTFRGHPPRRFQRETGGKG